MLSANLFRWIKSSARMDTLAAVVEARFTGLNNSLDRPGTADVESVALTFDFRRRRLNPADAASPERFPFYGGTAQTLFKLFRVAFLIRLSGV